MSDSVRIPPGFRSDSLRPTDRPTDRPTQPPRRKDSSLPRHAPQPVDNWSCRHCNGSGWEDGPDEWETVQGEPHRYTTVIPCRHTRTTSREWTGRDA